MYFAKIHLKNYLIFFLLCSELLNILQMLQLNIILFNQTKTAILQAFLSLLAHYGSVLINIYLIYFSNEVHLISNYSVTTFKFVYVCKKGPPTENTSHLKLFCGTLKNSHLLLWKYSGFILLCMYVRWSLSRTRRSHL